MSGAGLVLVDFDGPLAPIFEGTVAALSEQGIAVARGPAARWLAEGHDASAPEILVLSPRVRLESATLQALPSLHTVLLPTTGIEAVSLAEASALGIVVANGGTDENALSMAEATALLILALCYRLPQVLMGALAPACPPAQQPPPEASLLRGRTVGLVGYGAIARALAPRLHAFETQVLVHSSRGGLAAPGVQFVTLEQLLERSDFVCVLAALNPRTHHLIGVEELARMRRTAFLVNTARGAIVDEAALIEALQSGRIAGAALDVFEHEPLPEDSPLRRLPNVILTPHRLGHTRESRASFLPALLENLAAARAGRLPPRCRNPEVAPRWRRLNQSR